MNDAATLHRRQLLQRAMLLAGLAAIPSEILAAVPESAAPLLDKASFNLVTAVADTLIPRTDTPGAVDADVPSLLGDMLKGWASAATRSELLGALQGIDSAARARAGMTFAALDPRQRHLILTEIDGSIPAMIPGYARLKDLMTILYYLSEPGSTIELRYEQVPGRWDPSLPVTPESRTEGGATLF
ncbi:hypothetical protein FHS49_001689 [Sphingobium boeckii]|uniref:Gluconate 2-dehydrogenase subunit 3 family protein n=2 Tax=Sphingobium boeckii TaxID=1082345 RepID=A0A7W9AHT8_9SPHN|nr:hypothetical protein [Sphingobium boeckii]